MKGTGCFNPNKPMDFPILIEWVSQHFKGNRSMFDEIHASKQNIPDGTPRLAASHLELFCLLMSH